MKRLAIAAVGLALVALAAGAIACGGGEGTPAVPPTPLGGMVPEGWERHRTAKIQIDLPETWVFFDPIEQTYEAFLEMLRRQSPELVSRAEKYIAPNLEEIEVFAFDTESVNILDNLAIGFQELLFPTALPTLVNQLEAGWLADPGHRLVSSESDLTVGGLSAGRLVGSASANLSDLMQVQYVLLSEPSTAFILVFASGADSFERLEPVFEEIAQSFRVLDSP